MLGVIWNKTVGLLEYLMRVIQLTGDSFYGANNAVKIETTSFDIYTNA